MDAEQLNADQPNPILFDPAKSEYQNSPFRVLADHDSISGHIQGSIQSSFKSSGTQNESPVRSPLVQSLDELGQLTPIILWRYAGDLVVVDGFKRAAWAAECGQTLAAHLLREDVTAAELVTLLFSLRYSLVRSSTVMRARFLRLARELGLGDELLKTEWLPRLEYAPNMVLLRRLLKLTTLPSRVLDFCHQKSFSLKQCYRLTQYDPVLLEFLFDRQAELALTASLVEEILSGFSAYLLRVEQPASALLEMAEIEELFAATVSPQERTARLRRFVRELRNPLLTERTQLLQDLATELNLPSTVAIDWDPSLERLELHFRLNVRSVEELRQSVESLADRQTTSRAAEMLELL